MPLEISWLSQAKTIKIGCTVNIGDRQIYKLHLLRSSISREIDRVGLRRLWQIGRQDSSGRLAGQIDTRSTRDAQGLLKQRFRGAALRGNDDIDGGPGLRMKERKVAAI